MVTKHPANAPDKEPLENNQLGGCFPDNEVEGMPATTSRSITRSPKKIQTDDFGFFYRVSARSAQKHSPRLSESVVRRLT